MPYKIKCMILIFLSLKRLDSYFFKFGETDFMALSMVHIYFSKHNAHTVNT